MWILGFLLLFVLFFSFPLGFAQALCPRMECEVATEGFSHLEHRLQVSLTGGNLSVVIDSRLGVLVLATGRIIHLIPLTGSQKSLSLKVLHPPCRGLYSLVKDTGLNFVSFVL